MKNKGDLTFAERLEISILLEKGYSKRSIAKALKRGHNTVSYEVKNNSTKGRYDPHKAQAKARLRKRMRRTQYKKINKNNDLRAYVIDGLKQGWNPDEISGRMKREKKPFYMSKTAIYDWLYTSRGARYCKYLYTRRCNKKKRVKKTQRIMIPNRVGIQERTAGANNRTRYGHTENDFIVSPAKTRNTDAISVLVERKSRYVDARKVGSRKPNDNVRVFKQMTEGRSILSVTLDNGIENKKHETFGVPSFFCDPYASWQKGGVENANKMLRRYVPKSTNLKTVSPEKLARIVDLINNKPRKILGYRSAREVALQSGYIKSECPN